MLVEEQQWYYLIHSWEDKVIYTFSKSISPKVNEIARLEFELLLEGHNPAQATPPHNYDIKYSNQLQMIFTQLNSFNYSNLILIIICFQVTIFTFTTDPLAYWVEYSPMARETGVQSQVEPYQRL